MTEAAGPAWQRRARPLLGTLVEVGIAASTPAPAAAFEQAFAALVEIERGLSYFDDESDTGRFNRMSRGARLRIRPVALPVFKAARVLCDASDGVFDITRGTGPYDWQCTRGWLHKNSDEVRIDLGGIAKGHAVDCAVRALQAAGCTAGWVNAGGDLRAFGMAAVPVVLRDEAAGGVRPFATVCEGALATSHFDATSRSRLFCGRSASPRIRSHASVAAPLCLWADALTKLVAATGDVRHPLLMRYGASAWIHTGADDDPRTPGTDRASNRPARCTPKQTSARAAAA